MANIKSPIGGIRSPGIFPTIEMRSTPGVAPSMKVADKDAAAFQDSLQQDPTTALAGLGISVAPEEARRVGQQIAEMKARGPGAREMALKINGGVTVTGTINFGKK